MSYKSEHSGKWGETHYGGGINLTSDVGVARSISFGTHRESPALPTLKPSRRIVSKSKKHTLFYSNTQRAYFDYVPVHGRTYLGKFRDDDEAGDYWFEWLRPYREDREDS